MAAMFITARLLGPEGRGVLVIVVAWASLFASFAGLSLGQVSQYRIQLIGRAGWLPGILGVLFFFAGVLSLIACLVAFVVYQATGGAFFAEVPGAVFAVGFLLLPLLIWEEYGSHLLMAADRVRARNVALVTGRTIGIAALIVFLVVLGMGVMGALLAEITALALIAIIGIVVLWRAAGRGISVQWGEVGGMLTGALKLHLNTIGAVLLVQANVVMLGYLATPSDVAWYQLGFQMIAAMLVIPNVASMIVYSRMAELGPDGVWPEQKRLIVQMLGVAAVLSLAMYFLAPSIVHILAGPDFEPSIEVIRALVFAVPAMYLVQLMTPQWIGRGVFLPTSVVTLTTAAANIALNFVLIPDYGIMGAVWAMLAAYLGVAVVVQLCFAVWCEAKYRAARQHTAWTG